MCSLLLYFLFGFKKLFGQSLFYVIPLLIRVVYRVSLGYSRAQYGMHAKNTKRKTQTFPQHFLYTLAGTKSKPSGFVAFLFINSAFSFKKCMDSELFVI